MKADDRLLRSRRQERQGMQRFGGVQNPRSGARWDRKNDGRTEWELIEFKRTDNERSITLLHKDLRGLRQHAVVEGRLPVLCFELAGEHFVVLPDEDYHELTARRGLTSRLRTGKTRLARLGQVSGSLRSRPGEPVLRGPSTQRTGERSKVGLLRNPPRSSRTLSSGRAVSGVRTGERGEVGRLGRVQRKGTSGDQTGTAS